MSPWPLAILQWIRLFRLKINDHQLFFPQAYVFPSGIWTEVNYYLSWIWVVIMFQTKDTFQEFGTKGIVIAVQFTQLCLTPWTAAHQASLSFTISQSLFKLTSIELMMPSNHLILFCPLLLLPSIFSSIRVFSNGVVLPIRWSNYWSFSISPSRMFIEIRWGVRILH